MRFHFNLMSALGLTLLVACGGLKDDPAAPSGPVADDGVVNSNGDIDGDGFEDGVDDPIVIVQDGTVLDESTGAYLAPMVCAHQSIVMWDDDACLAGYGSGVQDGWATPECVVDMDWWVLDGDHFVCGRTVDNGDIWRGNIRNALSYCLDESHPDYGSFACWANLTDEARKDDYTTRNEDGTYALSWFVDDGWIFPGFDDGSGEE